jgi:isopenicillin-N epimerase
MYSPYINHWQLNQEITYLNHGSFGATPLEVLAKQQYYRDETEKEAVDFFLHKMPALLSNSKKSLAGFVGANADNIVFVQNTTTGVNCILNSLPSKEGDEWLTLNIAYGACVNALGHYAKKKKCTIVTAEIPYPVYDNTAILDAIEKAITPNTTFALIDYITSSTGFILPIQEIISLLQSKNIMVLVDGAHAPGMVHLSLEKMKPDFFVGNCHKWICSPKGSALMYVAPQHQAIITPLIISHQVNETVGTTAYWSSQFEWDGTHDYSQYLCVKEAIAFFDKLIGWENTRKHNHDLVWEAGNLIAEKLNVTLPVSENMVGSLLNIPLPDCDAVTMKYHTSLEFKKMLFEKYKIEVPIFNFPKAPKQWLRISAQLYNSIEQYAYLAECLRAEL